MMRETQCRGFRGIVPLLLALICSCSAEPEPFSVLASEQREGYVCQLIEYSGIPAYLLLPDEAGRTVSASGEHKFPGLVLLHDHGARFDIGKEKLVRPIAAPTGTSATTGAADYIVRSSQQWVDKNFDGAYFADSLAAAGYVVLVPDALYWGGRSSEDAQQWSRLSFGAQNPDSPLPKEVKSEIKRLKTAVYEGQRDVYAELEGQGIVWAEQILEDDRAAVALLAGLPCVDSDRIGAFGFSMGAHRAWLLAAFEPQIRCAVAVCWMTSLDVYEGNNASDLSMRIPRLREEMDFPEIAKYLVPRPMLFISGKGDRLFPQDAVLRAFDRMHEIYSEAYANQDAASAPSNLETILYDGGHHCGLCIQALTKSFFDNKL